MEAAEIVKEMGVWGAPDYLCGAGQGLSCPGQGMCTVCTYVDTCHVSCMLISASCVYVHVSVCVCICVHSRVHLLIYYAFASGM